MKATLTNYRQSPRKVTLVAKLIRGKSVTQARQALTFLPKKSAPDMRKLLDSAIANARAAGASTDELVVKTITVNKGKILRRFMPKARGRAARFHRTMSHVSLELGAAKVKPAKKVVAKKAAKKKEEATA